MLSIDCVNIYFFQSIVTYIFFNRFKSVGLPHIATAYIMNSLTLREVKCQQGFTTGV